MPALNLSAAYLLVIIQVDFLVYAATNCIYMYSLEKDVKLCAYHKHIYRMANSLYTLVLQATEPVLIKSTEMSLTIVKTQCIRIASSQNSIMR